MQPPSSGPQIWPLSVEAYHALGELGLIPQNTELIYGQIFFKMPKSPYHSYLIQLLLNLLLRWGAPGHLVRSEQPITCANSEPEPDLSVVKGELTDFRNHHPTTAELVIEVCVTSHEYERSKIAAYATAGIKELWLVLAPEKQIEVHRRPGGDHFAEQVIVGPGGQLMSTALGNFSVDLDSLFAS